MRSRWSGLVENVVVKRMLSGLSGYASERFYLWRVDVVDRCMQNVDRCERKVKRKASVIEKGFLVLYLYRNINSQKVVY